MVQITGLAFGLQKISEVRIYIHLAEEFNETHRIGYGNVNDYHSRFDALLALKGGSCKRSGQGRGTGSRDGPAGDKDQRALDHG